MTPRTLRLTLALSCAILLAGAPRAARAADDAGTRSVFAHGLGNRALGMGSAYVAIADDPSAMFWNPAGLGIVARGELQFDQSTSGELGFRETNAAFALPSWRWGTAGVTFRNFGTSDIEQRDDRNVLLASDLNDSETELSLGYGRPIGGTFSVGGTVKLEEQRLAGFSGSGLGLDLGFQAVPAWARGARFGIALRNAIQPSIRLDREAVPDLATLRGGVGYQIQLGETGSLLAELDLEGAHDVSQIVHAGAEYQYAHFAALRLGMNGGMMTAGTGFMWRQFSFDYAFENNPIGATHRLGLGLHFGPTVDESRLAARRAEDAALEGRLAQAFDERQAEQVKDLLDRAAAAKAQGQTDDALEALGAVLTLDPADSAALALQFQCYKSKAAQLEAAGDFAAAAATYDLARGVAPSDSGAARDAARCRAESDQRAARGDDLRRVFAAAMEALAADDLKGAHDGFAAVLAQDPTDADASRMLVRTEQAIARRAARIVESASRAMAAGRLGEAATQLAEAAALDAHAAGLAEASGALARARQLTATSQAARLATRPARGRETTPRSILSDREVEQLYRLGLEAIRAHRTEDAIRYWEHVLAERSSYREVGAFLKREYLARGMDAFATGKLEEAVSWWEKVLRIDPTNVQATGYLARAQEQIARSREILGSGP